MSAGKGWDLTSSSALVAAAEWLRKGSGALVVMVIRVDDLAVAADPQLAPADALGLIEDRQAEMHAELVRVRTELRRKLDAKVARNEGRR